MRIALICVSSFLLYGCALLTTERETIVQRPPVYTADEVDALNAEIQCKNLARNAVQVARCSTKR
jgi:hypothetical protein